MGTVACHAIEFGLIRCCSNINGVFRGRVSKIPVDKVEYHQFLKRIGRHTDFSVEKREWLLASY